VNRFVACPFFPGAHLSTRTAATCQAFFFQAKKLSDNRLTASPVVFGSPIFYQKPCCLSILFFNWLAFVAASAQRVFRVTQEACF
jgi:hypothetical protein